MELGPAGSCHAVLRPAVDEVRIVREVSARIDMPVLGCHDVVKLSVVGVNVLADGTGELRPALDGHGAAFAEIVLHVDDDQGAGHQFSS